ncbi:40S ribosomal protein S3a [Strongyloides ratti]|uniref:Small ribosomal subunit protein eS1 n=1 Tax=Strongyloides ratti TaxID=34506 RepID=A0A090MYY9_STRRB|nr:40S ribosomal protein S3a [Strongyloides ratti]CEF68014.1 40S ribosomal protein S3a [Strongyloides ratti]
MAVGKNKKMGKKGAKKKIIDPFTRKEWYDIKAPSMFTTRQVGKTFINKTQGTKIASEGLKGRVFEVSLGDLNKSESDFRKFRLICEDVQGRNVLTNFHGMNFTRDKLCSIVKKWHTLIQANVAVKTTDGYVLRLFAIGFTKRAPRQIKKTSYAQSSQVRAIRAKMVEIIQKEVGGSSLKEVVNKLIPDSIGKDMEKACSTIFPLQDVYIRKVKILKKPKFEHGKFAEIHGDGGAYTTAEGVVVDKPDNYEPPVQESV